MNILEYHRKALGYTYREGLAMAMTLATVLQPLQLLLLLLLLQK